MAVSGLERYGDQLFSQGSDGEHARLFALAAAFDPASRARLTALGVGPGWRCLDLGSGPGTVARWLADQVGERGQVVAVDREGGLLAAAAHPGVAVVEADVTDPDFDPGRFDLVHARLLLTHLRDRDLVLGRMAGWVRPGGWLVVSDAAELGSASSPSEALHRVLAATTRVLAERIGTDVNCGRRYPAALADCGLVDVGAAVELPVVAADTAMGAFQYMNIEQSRELAVSTGLVDDATVDEALRYLRDPRTWDLTRGMITAWGRRPS